MKHALKLVIFAGFVAFLGGCVNTLEKALPSTSDATNADAVTTAIDYFNFHARESLTRATDQEPTSEAPYLVGNLIPDWDSSVTVANEQKSYTDFEMQKDYRYYLVLEKNADTLRGLQLYSRFVSVIDYELDTLSQYVATYIPTADYVGSYVNEYGEIDCSAWGDFSGVVLYTMLSGHHVAAYRYNDGILEGDSFLYNYDKSQGENTTDFLTVMNGLELFVLPAEEETRASLPSHIKYIIVEVKEDNTIISHQYLLLGNNNQDDFYNNDTTTTTGPIELVEPTILPSTGGGGGGQTSTTTDAATRAYRKELTQSLFTTDSLTEDQIQEVGKMLEQIMQDCMGGELFNKLVKDSKFIKITFNSEKISQYNYDSHSIILKSYNSDTLLHEMFHAYQYSVLGNEEYNKADTNYEIEAQIARYNFLLRRSDVDGVNNHNDFTSTNFGAAISRISSCFTSKGIPITDRSQKLEQNYPFAVNYILNNAKEMEMDMIFKTDFSPNDNVQNVIDLSESC